jgi:3-hydroxypropanoate dehydrogenase
MLSNSSIEKLFTNARSQNGWLKKDITDKQIHQLYDLLKFGPTSANCCPARFTFIRTKEAKERLKPFLDRGNINKSMSAPSVAIISYDVEFYKKLPFLSPHNNAISWYKGQEQKIKFTAKLNATLQGAYFIIAARSIGLDCSPMIGFNREKLNQEFFPNEKVKSIFICGIGYGDDTKVYPRAPRLDFEDVCEIL